MRKNDTLVFGVVYPGVEDYLEDYVSSLQNQNSAVFDIYILNDGGPELEKKRVLPSNTTVESVVHKATIAEVRQLGINYAISRGYTYLIFTDTDDYFSDNRVSCSVSALSEYDFVFNDITIVDERKKCIATDVLKKLGVSDGCIGVEQVIEKNIFGLSNTAVLVRALQGMQIPTNVVAVDWWLFSCLLLNNCRTRLVSGCSTFYRQTENNTVGMFQPLTDERLFRGITAKESHYKEMAKYCKRIDRYEDEKRYTCRLKGLAKLSREAHKVDFRKEYIDRVNRHLDEIYSGWWSEIVTIEEMERYE